MTLFVTLIAERKGRGGGMWDSIFGTQKAVDNIVDKDNGLLKQFGGWANDLHLSDAERAQNEITRRKLGIKLLAALEPFKIVQRILAFATMFLWSFVGLNIVFALWIEAIFNHTVTTTIDGVVTVTTHNFDISGPLIEFAMSQYVLIPVSLVLGLYMSGGAAESISRMKAKT